MRAIWLAVLCVSPGAAFAVDFRGVELGDTCRHAAQVETSLGTRPREDVESMVAYNVVSFEDDSIAGQHSQFLYGCRKRPGIITSYSITTRTRSEPLAWQIYAAAKAAAVSRLGVPSADSATPDATAQLSRLRARDITATYAFANWNSVEHQSVVVTIEKPPDDAGWSISTIVSAASVEEPDKPRTNPGR
jgi:hypothetical protein